MEPGSDHNTLLQSALACVLEFAEEGILVFDTAAVCGLVSTRVGDLFGIDPRTLVGKTSEDVLGVLAAACLEPDGFLSALSEEHASPDVFTAGDFEMRNPYRLITWTSHPMSHHGRKAIGRIVFVRDVTRGRSAERARQHLLLRIEQLTHVDPLTALANRSRFIEEHAREHGRATRSWDCYAVLRVDIDGMHQINDAYGMPFGDKILEEVANLIGMGRREYDLVARWQDDEFALLLPGADIVAARAVANRVQTSVLAHGTNTSDWPKVTVSIGGAICKPPTVDTAENVMMRCREALQTARGRGVNELEIDVPQSET